MGNISANFITLCGGKIFAEIVHVKKVKVMAYALHHDAPKLSNAISINIEIILFSLYLLNYFNMFHKWTFK